jgi:hypothetical protein
MLQLLLILWEGGLIQCMVVMGVEKDPEDMMGVEVLVWGSGAWRGMEVGVGVGIRGREVGRMRGADCLRGCCQICK